MNICQMYNNRKNTSVFIKLFLTHEFQLICCVFSFSKVRKRLYFIGNQKSSGSNNTM